MVDAGIFESEYFSEHHLRNFRSFHDERDSDATEETESSEDSENIGDTDSL